MKKYLIFSICLIGLVGIFNFADAKSYYYYSIEADVTVNPDSTFDVIEKQTYKLDGNFGYFYRDIELKDLDHISDIKVFDSQGKELKESQYDLSYNGNRRHIQWNFNRRDFNDELKSWTVAYKAHGGLGLFKNYDELYWNAIFADRTVKVHFADLEYSQLDWYVPVMVHSSGSGSISSGSFSSLTSSISLFSTSISSTFTSSPGGSGGGGGGAG